MSSIFEKNIKQSTYKNGLNNLKINENTETQQAKINNLNIKTTSYIPSKIKCLKIDSSVLPKTP